jgi:hypothetical protein
MGGAAPRRSGAAIQHLRQQQNLQQSQIPHEPRDVDESQALLFDPDTLREWHEVLEATRTHSQFGVYALKQIARAPGVQAIVNTRLNQLANFSRPREDKYGTGFQLVTREAKRSPTKQEKLRAREITKMIQTCGSFDKPYERFQRKHFDVFLQECGRDSLVLDVFPFEVIMDRRDKYPRWWQPVDGAKIFRVIPQNPYGNYSPTDAAYVQRWQDQDVAWWAMDQLCCGVRRSRTDMESQGYGYPELAECLEVVTGMLVGWAYNFKFFQNGGPRGVVSVNGEIAKKKLLAFQRQMLWAASGLKNAFRTLIVNPSGPNASINWVPFGVPNKEMEFSSWIDSNFRMLCAVFGIEPDETGYHYGNGTGQKALFETSPEAKLKYGKSKGLSPFLRKIEFFLNQYIVWRLENGEDFELQFLGDGAMSENERADLDEKLVRSTHTIDEVRAEHDLPPLPDGKGEFILNPTYYQIAVGVDQAAQGGMGGGMDGQGGSPGQDAAGGAQDGQNGAGEQGGGGDAAGPDLATDWGDAGASVPEHDWEGAAGGAIGAGGGDAAKAVAAPSNVVDKRAGLRRVTVVA